MIQGFLSIHRHKRFYPLASVLAAVMLAAPALAQDAYPASRWGNFDEVAVVDEHELADMRGGFTLAGLEMQFGANARTYLDGILALETLINVTDAGPVVQPVTPSPGSASPVPGATLILDSASGVAGASLRDIAAPANVDLSGLADGANGVVVNDHKGFTAALHQVTQERILSVLVNTGTDRAIRHELDINVTVSNFREFQQGVRSAVLNNRLVGTINPLNR